MKKPLHATVVTPPAVEYVAVGRGAAGFVVGGVLGGLLGWVVGGTAGGLAVARPGWGVCDRAGPGPAGSGTGSAERGSSDGTVEVELVGFGVVMPGVVLSSDAPGCSANTTSRWRTTGAGRSVRSAATVDVPAQTMAVAAAVTHTHSPTANNRRTGTSMRMLLMRRSGG
jgi:hypothetical protein